MRTFLLLALTSLLLAAGIPEEAEPGACLLQHASSEIQRAVLVQEKSSSRQDPAQDLANRNDNSENDNGDTANDSGDVANDSSKEEDKKGFNKSDDKKEAADDKESGSNEQENKKPAKHTNDEKEKSEEKEKEKSDEKGNDEEKQKDHGKKDEHEEKHEGHDDTNHKKKPKDDENEEIEEDAPGASLRLELWLPIPIRDLKGPKKGPLPIFLSSLRSELVTAANVSIKRLDVLGVRGEYSDDGVLSFFARDVKASLQEGPVVAEEMSHSIVDLEVLPATQESDPSPKAILKLLQEQLSTPDSALVTGPLKDTLPGAKLVIKQGVEGLLPHDKSGATRQDLRSIPLVLAALIVSPLALLL